MDFKETIKSYCDEMARKDKSFARVYKRKDKSIDECVRYIFSEMEKRATVATKGKVAAVEDDEVFGLAVHYFHEDIVVPETKQAVKVLSDTPSKKTVKKSTKRAEKTQKVTSELAIEIPLFDI